MNEKFTKPVLTAILSTLLILLAAAAWTPLQSQVAPKVPFTQRTSASTPDTKVYNIKGDFQMIGNSNLLPSDANNFSNNQFMNYADVDGDAATINSSSAQLLLTIPTGASTACSNIIYAGLYWLGRAHDGTSPNTFMVGGTTNNYTNTNTINGYTLSISSTTGNSQTATYTFTPATGNPVIFRLTTDDNENITSLTVQIGTGTPTTLTFTSSDSQSNWWSENYVEATLNTPYTVNTGTTSILVNNLRASTANNTIDDTFRANVSYDGKVLDKRVVKLKFGTGAYTTVQAQDDNFTKNIYYPTTTDGYMYSAYAEVTDFVKANKEGTYTVANIALNTGEGGGTGFFGGWAMVVVYENPKMTLRDVTIFDGHAVIAEASDGGYNNGVLEVSGFNTVQTGTVNMKVGIVAGEGDLSVGGTTTNYDDFSILDANTTTETWRPLSSSGTNPQTNFFKSAIVTTGTRNPSDANNYGIDIVNVTINPDWLKNEQTSTKFRYGTSQDTYIIPVIAMAVDAYIPDLRPLISGTVNDLPVGSTTTVEPGGNVVYKLELSNPPTPGNEPINNVSITIAVPYTASYVSSSAVINGVTTPGSVVYSATEKKITWTVGNIPLQAQNAAPYATLTYTLKVTEDPTILCNPNCTPKVILVGSASGTGAESGSDFSNLRFIQGYETGVCENTPITTPLSIDINTANLAEDYCDAAGGGNISFTYCDLNTAAGNPIDFNALKSRFPAGVRFWSAYTTEEVTNFVKPADGATEYLGADINIPTGQTSVTQTYYAIPPGATTCYWIVTINVEKCNFWMGTTASTDWNTETNWTQGIPGTGSIKNDVIFATATNYGTAAVNDLLVNDATGMKTIDNLTNESGKALIIPVEKTLIINEKAKTNAPERLVIKSEKEKANGALIFVKPNQNTDVQATVQFASKSQPATGTWPRAWQYFGTPVTGKKLNELFPANIQGSIYGGNPATNTIVRKYEESLVVPSSYQEKWKDLDLAESILPYYGYEITQSQTAFDNASTSPYQFKGALVTGNSNLPLPVSASSVYAYGSFVLANPYAAPVFYDNLTDDDFGNLEKVVYIFNTGSRQNWIDLNGESQLGNLPGTYTSIPLYTGTTIGMTQIPSMQGFLVGASTLSGTSTFKFRYETVYRPAGNTTSNEAMLAPRAGAGKNPKGRPARELKPLITMDVIGQNSSDRVYLITAGEATKGYDDGWDGYKFISPNVAQLYAFDSNDTPLQVHSDNDLNETCIGFRSGGESSYKLRFRFSNMESVYSDIILEDLATGTTTKLKDGTTLSFSPSTGTAEKRFKITAKVTKGNSGDKNSKFLKIRAVSDRLLLENSTTDSGDLTVYDLVGTKVFQTTFGPGFNEYMLNFKKGSYIIEAKTATERTVIKSIIK